VVAYTLLMYEIRHWHKPYWRYLWQKFRYKETELWTLSWKHRRNVVIMNRWKASPVSWTLWCGLEDLNLCLLLVVVQFGWLTLVLFVRRQLKKLDGHNN